MPTFEATLTSNAVLRRDNFGRFLRQIESGGERLMEDLAIDFENRARRYAPVRTGRLKRSIQAILLNGYRTIHLVSDAPYARYMEEGTRPHLIRGVRRNFRWRGKTRLFVWNNPEYGPIGTDNSRYENWTWEGGATVRHPGTRGYFFFRRAYRETMADARISMQRAYRG